MSKWWTETLSEDVYQRFCSGQSTKNDIVPLTQARWNFIKENEKFCKEDALVYVLELLESNSCDFDLTVNEYNEVLASIYG